MKESTRIKVETIRKEWAVNDRLRDEHLTEPEHLRNYYDISYGPYGDANLLDIYMPEDTTEKTPAIVNIHGGGWVYGTKEIYRHYCMRLAARGFVVVNFNYRLGPEIPYPAAIEDINQLLTFVADNADDYFIDKERLVVVGDSAGGQLASQYLTILTNPAYASLFGLAVPDVKVRAAGLNCGAYDAKAMVTTDIEDLFAAYVGYDETEVPEEILKQLDVCGNITEAFPPSYVMSTATDFLLKCAEPMYRLLQSRGVPSVIKIYGSEDRPEIGHVFHVNSNLEEAAVCNDEECEFFRKYL